MGYRVNPQVTRDLQKYGGDTFSKCFNCGNCTAVCSLTDEVSAFPRQFIRYVQLGMKEKMLESPEPWMCYYCGDCTDTCPREAEPGELMAASRRWLIGWYDVTGLARIFYTSAPLSILIMAVLAVILGLTIMSGSGTMRTDEIALWEYMSADVVHNVGLVVIAFVIIAGLLGVINMGSHLSRSGGLGKIPGTTGVRKKGSGNWLSSAVKIIFVQVLGHKRYIKCDEEDVQPWHLKRWFLHGSTAWGFFGLLIATMLHWILAMAGLKETATWVPVYSIPIRILGIVAGLFLIYGSTILLYQRLSGKPDKQAEVSTPSDWIFLLFVWFAGLTGFLVLIGESIGTPMMWTYPMLLIHVVISMELVLLAPFTKFAHVFYRTVGLFIHEMRMQGSG